MSESAFKVGDFVERDIYRLQVIAINFEGNLVCFDKTREIPHTFHRNACRLIPGCESFDDKFPLPVPDCGSGWRLLRKGRSPELVAKGDQFHLQGSQWSDAANWKKPPGEQDFGLWYRRRVEPAADRTSEVLTAIRAAGKILRDAGIANVADALEDRKPDHVSELFEDFASDLRGSCVFTPVTSKDYSFFVWGLLPDSPAWHAGVGVDVVSREVV